MTEPSNDNVRLLMSMGFPDENSCRTALSLANNDINDALSYLTDETPGLSAATVASDNALPALQNKAEGNETDVVDAEDPLNFPTTHMYALETRVMASSWNVPVLRSEPLGRCLISCVALAKEGQLEDNADAQRFLNRSMLESFEKLLTTNQVKNWEETIQAGIGDMLILLSELAAACLHKGPIPYKVLEALVMAWDPSNVYHTKNASVLPDPRWEQHNDTIAVTRAKQPRGRLVDAVNVFAEEKGFLHLENRFRDPSLSTGDMEAMLAPLYSPSEYLDKDKAAFLYSCVRVAFQKVQDLSDSDLKTANGISAVDLLNCIHKLIRKLDLPGPPAQEVCEVKLNFILRLMRSAHFGARMQALRELGRVLEGFTETGKRRKESDLSAMEVDQWLADNGVLTLALEGNLDQAQYCERLRSLLTFVAPRLQKTDMSRIWALRRGRALIAVENVYEILAQTASKFNQEQLRYLASLIDKSWDGDGEEGRNRALRLLGIVGGKTQLEDNVELVVDLIWSLTHKSASNRRNVENGWEQQLGVINKSKNENLRAKYIQESMKDLQEGRFVTLSLTHMRMLVEGANGGNGFGGGWSSGGTRSGTRSDTARKHILHSLARPGQQDLVAVILACIVRIHADAERKAAQAVVAVRTSTPMDGGPWNKRLPEKDMTPTLTPLRQDLQQQLLLIPAAAVSPALGPQPEIGRDLVLGAGGETFGEYLMGLLRFLDFALREIRVDFPWQRAKELWESLMETPNSSSLEREECFAWFADNVETLSEDTRQHLMKEKLLALKPETLPLRGFYCFRKYFEEVNKLKQKNRGGFSFSRTSSEDTEEPVGMDFLWDLSLLSGDCALADEARAMLIHSVLDKRCWNTAEQNARINESFLRTCFLRLEALLSTDSLSAKKAGDLARALGEDSTSPPPGSHSPTLPPEPRVIHRLLLVVKAFLAAAEDLYQGPVRTAPGHGSRQWGEVVELFCRGSEPEQGGSSFAATASAGAFVPSFHLLAHSNETLRSIRQRAAARAQMDLSRTALYWGQDEIPIEKDAQTLFQLSILACFEQNPGQSMQIELGIKKRSSFPAYDQDRSIARHSAQVRLDFADMDERPAQKGLPLFLEKEKALPGVILAAFPATYELLDDLAMELGAEHLGLEAEVRAILAYLPQNPIPAVALDSLHLSQETLLSTGGVIGIGLGKENGGKGNRVMAAARRKLASMRASDSSSASAPGSPKSARGHKTHSRNPSNASVSSLDAALSPEERLRHLLDPSLPPIKLLYNLQLLSSRLLPTFLDSAAWKEADEFCTAFSNAGGLRLLTSLLRKESLPSNGVSLDVRRDMYTCLINSLLYLLSGKSLPSNVVESEVRAEARSGRGFGGASADSGVVASLTIPSPTLTSTLSLGELGDLLASLEQLAWSSAAGCLHRPALSLAGASSNNAFFIGSPRSRLSESSTGSSNGTGNENGADSPSSVHAGLQTSAPDPASDRLTILALQLLQDVAVVHRKRRTCNGLRDTAPLDPVAESGLFGLPHFSKFLLDLLFYSSSQTVRQAMQSACSTLAKAGDGEEGEQSPRQRLLSILQKARLPLWIGSSSVRGSGRRLLAHCSEYFHLRTLLLQALPRASFDALNPDNMVHDEISWLLGYTFSTESSGAALDDTLIAGHLGLITGILTRLSPAFKLKEGTQLLEPLLYGFLFPASRAIQLGTAVSFQSREPSDRTEREVLAAAVRGAVEGEASRAAAYALVRELCSGCPDNFSRVADILEALHHQPGPELAAEWDYIPLTATKGPEGLVGLKNAGATCYMNAVLQQLYMEPGVAGSLLRVTEALGSGEADGTALLGELQRVLSELAESEAAWVEPAGFWSTFRMWGETAINLREQQDAFEFFTSLIDQIDGQLQACWNLKKLGRAPVFKARYQGVFSDVKRCLEGCHHKKEREEAFYALNLPLHSSGLEEALRQFVKGEILEGQNAYFCEECGVTRTAQKRTCIKSLPPVLCIQVKRFGYDWEEGRPLKFNDRFPFPRWLDMGPYTTGSVPHNASSAVLGVSGLGAVAEDVGSENAMSPPVAVPSGNRTTFQVGSAESPSLGSVAVGSLGDDTEMSLDRTMEGRRGPTVGYDLSAVVVHTGRSTAGHYYAFIKERRKEAAFGPSFGQWLKFNDTQVETVEFTDAFMEAELFGGQFTPKSSSVNYQGPRERHWNAYLLFYSRSETGNVTQGRTPASVSKRSLSMSTGRVAPRALLSPQGRTFGNPSRHISLVSTPPSSPLKGRSYRQDSLGHLTALVEAGEASVLFEESGVDGGLAVPPTLSKPIQHANLVFFSNRHRFSGDYIELVTDLVCDQVRDGTAETEATSFLFNFLVNFAWHTSRGLREPAAGRWANAATELLKRRPAAKWMLEWVRRQPALLRTLLFLEPSQAEIRSALGECVRLSAASVMGEEDEELLESLLRDAVVPLILGPAMEQWARAGAFWDLMRGLCSLPSTQSLLDKTGVLVGCLDYLFRPMKGPGLEELVWSSWDGDGGWLKRRWSWTQAKELSQVFAIVAKLLPQSPTFLKKPYAAPIVTELFYAFVEIEKLQEPLEDFFLAASQDRSFVSKCILRELMTSLGEQSQTQTRLRRFFGLLEKLIKLHDSLSYRRLLWLLDGMEDAPEGGLLGVLNAHDGRQRYAFLKQLTELANQIPTFQEAMLARTEKWQWAVTWLETAMTEAEDAGTSSSSTSIIPIAPAWQAGLPGPSASETGGEEASNSEGFGRAFLRTVSAQYTLDTARGILRSSQPPSPDGGAEDSNASSSLVEMDCSSEASRDSAVSAPSNTSLAPAVSSTTAVPSSSASASSTASSSSVASEGRRDKEQSDQAPNSLFVLEGPVTGFEASTAITPAQNAMESLDSCCQMWNACSSLNKNTCSDIGYNKMMEALVLGLIGFLLALRERIQTFCAHFRLVWEALTAWVWEVVNAVFPRRELALSATPAHLGVLLTESGNLGPRLLADLILHSGAYGLTSLTLYDADGEAVRLEEALRSLLAKESGWPFLHTLSVSMGYDARLLRVPGNEKGALLPCRHRSGPLRVHLLSYRDGRPAAADSIRRAFESQRSEGEKDVVAESEVVLWMGAGAGAMLCGYPPTLLRTAELVPLPGPLPSRFSELQFADCLATFAQRQRRFGK